MNVFLYIIIFIMGTLFGSFYTLAVYRIPKNIDITRTHSFCPNCGHKLGFFELIPVFSYIFLGGKCKKCKEKIRPRYFILEVLSGISFILIAYALKIDGYNLNLYVLLKFLFIALYLVALFIIAGIDKEEKRIEKSVLYYGVIETCLYIIYLCIMEPTSIYRYVMYLITFIILLILDTRILLKHAKDSYIIQNLILILLMIVNTGEIIALLTVFVVFISILIAIVAKCLYNLFNKSKKININIKNMSNFGYLFSIINVVLFVISLLEIRFLC